MYWGMGGHTGRRENIQEGTGTLSSYLGSIMSITGLAEDTLRGMDQAKLDLGIFQYTKVTGRVKHVSRQGNLSLRPMC